MSTSKALTIDKIINELIEREGGFVDHSDDLGGPTKYGVTVAVARASGYRGEMADMPRSKAEEIYLNQYYFQPSFNRLLKYSLSITTELVDTGVNMGIARAAKFLQLSLNALNNQGSIYSDIAVDGAIGNQTLAAFSTYFNHRGLEGESVMLKALNCLQGARYIELSEAREANESFTYGWLRERVVI